MVLKFVDMEDMKMNIEMMREKMIYLGMRRGLSDPEVLQMSQELDKLLNKYNLHMYSRVENGVYAV